MAYLSMIAGPNGAGKSTHNTGLLTDHGIKPFDYDYELKTAWSKFGFDPYIEQGVRDSVSEKFLELKEKSLQDNLNFAFETNYNSETVVETVKQFSGRGFKTELVFIALESADIAIERVKERVSKGGHNVSIETIRARFIEGLFNLDKTFNLYSEFQMILSTYLDVVNIATIDEYKNTTQYYELPSSLKPYLPRLSQFLKDNS